MNSSSVQAFLGQIFETMLTLLGEVIGWARDLAGNGALVTGLVIGFVLAFLFRGVIMKLLVVGFLVAVFYLMFVMPGMG